MAAFKKGRRRLGTYAAIVLTILAVMGLAWLTGWPQRWAVRHFIHTQLGADSHVSSLRLFPALKMGRLTLGDVGGMEQPAMDFEDLRVDYQLLHRPLDLPNQLSIKRLSIDLDSHLENNSNFDFLRNAANRFSGGPVSQSVPAYMPIQIGIETLGMSVKQPQASILAEGMRLNALLETPTRFAATLQADPLRLAWESPANHGQGEGRLLCSAKKEGQELIFDWDMGFPGFLAGKGDGRVAPSPEGTLCRAGIQEVVAEQAIGQELLPAYVPLLRFDRLSIADSMFEILLHANGHQVTSRKLRASLENLRVGTQNNPAFSGNVSVAAEAGQDADPALKGSVTLDGGKTALFTLSNTFPPQYGSLTVDSWTWEQFTRILPPTLRQPLESYGGIAALSTELSAAFEEQALSLSGNVRPRFHNNRLQEPSINFSARCTPPNWQQFQGKSISVDAGPMLRAGLSDWQFDAASNTGQGQMSCFLDLMEAAQRLYLPSLYGECTVSAPVQWRDSVLRFSPIEFRGEALGYGALALPYGIPLTIKGEGTITPGTRTFETGVLEGRLGDDTQLNVGRISGEIDSDGDAWKVLIEDAKIQSRLAPLTALNWLRQADGTAEFTAKSLEFTPGLASGRIDATLAAANAHLRDEWAVFTGVSLSGFAEWADVFRGQAVIEARETLALGALVHSLRGKIRLEDSNLFCEDVQGAVFDGALALDASLGAEGDVRVIQTAGRLEQIDLAVFTEEFKPPEVKLTGRASGTFDLQFRNEEIAGLTVHLESIEGCSLNRDAVQRILLSQYAEGMAGGKVASAIESAIGEAPQHPFDHARIDLALKGDKIAGDAILESGSLRLSIDIIADPQTLQDAILLRQVQRAEIAPDEGENAPLDAGGSSTLQ